MSCHFTYVTALLILQPFRHFTYVTAHSPPLPSLYLRHSYFSNSSVSSSTSRLILQPFFRIFYVTCSSLTSPGEPPMHYCTEPGMGQAKMAVGEWLEVNWRWGVGRSDQQVRLYLHWTRIFSWFDCLVSTNNNYHSGRPRADLSLQPQTPKLQFCPKQDFHRKLRNQGCSFTRDD